MWKRWLALLLSALLLSSTAFAAQAGSRSDPLLSRSFADDWAQAFLDAQQTALTQRIAAIGTDVRRQAAIVAVRSGENGIRRETLSAGARVLLAEGDSVTLLRGAGRVEKRAGVLVNVTTGSVTPSGRLDVGARYLACEKLDATLTLTEESELLLSGAPVVSRYTDCAPDAWYAISVDYAALRGLMSGVGNDRFSPDTTLTRAMFVTILGRMAGADSAEYSSSSFSDVAIGSWYAPYVEWGARNGIISGVGNGRFAPDDPVTREQMAALIDRYANAASITLPSAANPVRAFQDAAAVSGWAADSVELMRRTGILNGDSYGNFNPLNGAVRAEAAAVFCRLDALLRVLP